MILNECFADPDSEYHSVPSCLPPLHACGLRLSELRQHGVYSLERLVDLLADLICLYSTIYHNSN